MNKTTRQQNDGNCPITLLIIIPTVVKNQGVNN